MDAVLIALSYKQAKLLEGLLWEVCTDTDDGLQYLREDLPEAAIWRAVIDALEKARITGTV